MNHKQRKRRRILGIHACDETAQVVTLGVNAGERHAVRKEPCAECPWRVDAPRGAFPVEAYRHSANTAHDLAMTTFACHMAGVDAPMTCAGFALSTGAYHNMALRIAMTTGRYDPNSVRHFGGKLFRSYREMAIANGVDPKDPCLKGCR